MAHYASTIQRLNDLLVAMQQYYYITKTPFDSGLLEAIEVYRPLLLCEKKKFAQYVALRSGQEGQEGDVGVEGEVVVKAKEVETLLKEAKTALRCCWDDC